MKDMYNKKEGVFMSQMHYLRGFCIGLIGLILIGLTLTLKPWLGGWAAAAWFVYLSVILLLVIINTIFTVIEDVWLNRAFLSKVFTKMYDINIISVSTAVIFWGSLLFLEPLTKAFASLQTIAGYFPPNLFAYLFFALLFFLTKSILILLNYKDLTERKKLLIFNLIVNLTIAVLMWIFFTMLGYR